MRMKPPLPLPGIEAATEIQGPIVHVEVTLLQHPDGRTAQKVKVDTGNLPDTVEGWLAAVDFLNIAIKSAALKAVELATDRVDAEKPRVILPPAGLRLQN